MNLDQILIDIERAEDLRDNPGRYFPAKMAAEAKLREWAAANPDELAQAAGERKISRHLLEATLDRADLYNPPPDPVWVSDPGSHYNRASRMED